MNKIKTYFDDLGLNYKNEILIILLGNLILLVGGFALYYFLKQTLYLFIVLGLLLVFDVFLLFRYTNIKANIINSYETEFVTMMTYFQIFINNGLNVYTAINKLKDYAGVWMKERLDILTESIDKDKSVQPFVDFSKNFKTPIISNVMVSIFQMVDEGEDSTRLSQFNYLFSKMSEEAKNTLVISKGRKLDNLSVLPVLGSFLITAVILFGVISILGDITTYVL